MPTRKGRKVLVTPFGKPAAQMVPPPPATRDDGWSGCIRGRTTIVGDIVALDPLFDERLRRRWAAVEARWIGRGGVAREAAATGMSRTTIRAGVQELTAQEASGAEDDPGRVALADY